MNRQKGFTLVELLVVITVIGILVTLAVVNAGGLKTKAKETKVMGGAHQIQTALESFAQNHDGLYPGVALPAADDTTGFDPFFTSNGLYTMRGIIGGGVVKPQDPNLDFLDGFYFTPIPPTPPNPPVPPFQIPDRLVAEGDLTIYPEDPFRINITNVTDQAIPMLNMFGIEFRTVPDPTAADLFAVDPSPLSISEPLWFGFDNDPATISPPAAYDFALPGPDVRFRGDWNNALKYDLDKDWKMTRADIQQTGFPEGNFAYIPLDPVQTDATAPDFMRYCRNYWLVIYGSTDSAMRNRYKDVLPSFPRPLGTGRQHTDPLDFTGATANPATAYEYVVKQALVGAMAVIPTAYEDQLRVEGS